MATRYISSKTAFLYKNKTGNSRHYIFIHGDVVKTKGKPQGNPKNKRIKVSTRYSNVEGWVNEGSLVEKPSLEMYFIDVGQGDSTFIVTPKRKTILIDGGENDHAFRFLSWKYDLKKVKSNNPVIIDLLVLSHGDEDHLKGMIPIIKSPKIKIKKIIHNGLGLYKKNSNHNEKLGKLESIGGKKYITTSHDQLSDLKDSELRANFQEWKNAIADEGVVDYSAVDTLSDLSIGDPDIKLEVVSPINEVDSNGDRIFRWFGDHGPTINGHSVALRLTYEKVKILLSGDLNKKGSKYMMKSTVLQKLMDAHILKSPHHGSGDFYDKWLDYVNPQVSVISSGDNTDHGHPRANFIASIGKRSRSKSLVFSTEIAGSFTKLTKEEKKKIKISRKDMLHLNDKQYNELRILFKRRLHGMINVRTDGKKIFSARRVSAGYMWESYGGDSPSRRSISTKSI